MSDDEFRCGHEGWPLIEDGYYEAQCVAYNDRFCLGKARKLFLMFQIIDGKHQGKQIFQAFNMPYRKDQIRTGSKYYKAWVMMNGWNKPSRNALMSPRLFKNKICRIKTRTVIPKKPNGQDMPEPFWYSVVDFIHSVIQR